jgi:hypothetical protein
VHWAFSQRSPMPQGWSHAPQWFGSFSTFTQSPPPQSVRFELQEVRHCPREHTWPAPQALPQSPQWSWSDWRSAQTPAQKVLRGGHLHAPDTQS